MTSRARFSFEDLDARAVARALGGEASGSPAEVYLRQHRGIQCQLPTTLGFLPAHDPHPPALIAASPVNCSACNLLQLLACGEEVGCHSQVAALMCCIEDCKQSADTSCVEARCRSAVDSFGQCVYYRGEKCLKDDGELSGACFSK